MSSCWKSTSMSDEESFNVSEQQSASLIIPFCIKCFKGQECRRLDGEPISISCLLVRHNFKVRAIISQQVSDSLNWLKTKSFQITKTQLKMSWEVGLEYPQSVPIFCPSETCWILPSLQNLHPLRCNCFYLRPIYVALISTCTIGLPRQALDWSCPKNWKVSSQDDPRRSQKDFESYTAFFFQRLRFCTFAFQHRGSYIVFSQTQPCRFHS